jgi:glycerophosphoryl diester phosphodiesterase
MTGFSRHGRPLLIGHRGVRREGVDENTLVAFQTAVDEGAEAIELDARVCASGEPVVLHDAELTRVTDGADQRAAASLSLDEIERVVLANGARVPSLAAALAFARERCLPVNVELKRDAPSRPAVVRAVARLLDRWDPTHAILVSSFDPAMLAAFGALVPRIPRAMLVHRTGYHVLHAALAKPLGACAVNLERTLTRPELVRRIRARGLAVNVWTVVAPAEALDLAALGVDALITDCPGELRAVLDGGR